MDFKFWCVLIFWATAAEVIQMSDQFKLVGNSSHFEIFDESYFYLSRIDLGCAWTEFELSFVHVDSEILLHFFGKCTNLSKIILDEIDWYQNKTPSVKIHLPNLKQYKFVLSTKTRPWSSSYDLESIVFFYVNSSLPTTGLTQLATLNEFFVVGKFVNDGLLWFNKTHLETTNIQDQNIWKRLKGIWNGIQFFNAQNSILDVPSLDMKFMKRIFLNECELRNGKLVDIFKSAKVVEDLTIYNLEDEAVDVSLLPTQNLRVLDTVKISFRWSSSQRSVFVPELRKMDVGVADVDITLFNTTDRFTNLILFEMHLWNSSFADVGMKMSNLEHLSMQCQLQEGNRPFLLLDSLPKHLKTLSMTGIDLGLNSLKTRLDKLTLFILYNCNYPETLLDNLFKIFPKLTAIAVNLGNVIMPGHINKILHNITSLQVLSPFGTSLAEWSLFNERVKVLMNVSDLPYPNGATEIWFGRTNEGWKYEYKESTSYSSHAFTRVAILLRQFGISHWETKQLTLDVLYYTYNVIVYFTCAVGIICNSLSLAVFMRKSMRSSTTCLLLGLALCDTLYLMTALFTVEEFQLLFNARLRRSKFNGYFAYPLNKTAYTGSVYMTILITVGRFVAICFPLRISSIFSIEKTIQYIFGVLLITVFLNFPRWFEFIKWDYEASSPVWSWNFPHQLHRYPIYQIVFQKGIWYLTIYVLPFASIAILNLFIGIQARRAAIQRRVISSNTTNERSENKLTKVLLTIVFIFFICNALSASINWIFISNGIEPEVAEVFACLPIIINSSVNFILYYLMGSKFRKEYYRMLRSVWNYKCKKSSVVNSRQRLRQVVAVETRF